MEFKQIHQNFKLPTRATSGAGGYDLYMPERGVIHSSMTRAHHSHIMVGLGFAAKVPDGYVALILPRSGAGAKHGIELRNTCGVIDSDYTGEWKVAVKQKEGTGFAWDVGDRLFQYIVVPVGTFEPVLVDELTETDRGDTGFGGSGK